MDSLADVISFGLAPAVLAYAWGLQFIKVADLRILGEMHDAGYFISFLFLLCGAVRLARFNVQKNPIPKNPGRSDRKYFVGLPIPAAAAMVAAIVFASNGDPVTWWPLSIAWLGLLLLLGFLMVSTWRYYSFKGINLSKPYTPLILILLGAFIYGMWNYSRLMLLAMSTAYVASGILIRIGGAIRRRVRHAHPTPTPQGQAG
jgi:CDP-diacylglycerol--serine O-phosphatidyltransferase